jgi:hypothetical protein
VVDAVRFEGDLPILMMGNQQIAYDKVRQIQRN